MVAIKLNQNYGIIGVGIYLSVNAAASIIALPATHETKDVDLTALKTE